MANEELKERNIKNVWKIAYGVYFANRIEKYDKEKMLVCASGVQRLSVDRYFKSKTECKIETAKWIRKNIRDNNIWLHIRCSNKTMMGFEVLKVYL